MNNMDDLNCEQGFSALYHLAGPNLAIFRHVSSVGLVFDESATLLESDNFIQCSQTVFI